MASLGSTKYKKSFSMITTVYSKDFLNMNVLPWEAMVFILTVWMMMFVLFVGSGMLVLFVFGLQDSDTDKIFRFFWIGWAFSIFILQIWHIYFPVNIYAFALIAVIGFTGYLVKYKDLFFLAEEKGFYISFVFLTFIPALILSNRAVLAPTNIDSLIYHLQSVKWAETFPIIPGLGNLHFRLAFNSTHFLYVALLDIFDHQSCHLANGLLIFVFVSQILYVFIGLLRNRRADIFYGSLVVFFLVPVCSLMFFNALTGQGSISSPTTDVPIEIITFILTAQLLRMLGRFKCDNKEPSSAIDTRLFYMIILSVVGITIKATILVFTISTMGMCLGLYWHQCSKGNKNPWRMFNKIIACVLIGLVPWVLRNIILSGYPFYSVPILAVNVDWRIPIDSVTNNFKHDLLEVYGNGNFWTNWSLSNPLHTWHWLISRWVPDEFIREKEMITVLIMFSTGCLAQIISNWAKKTHNQNKVNLYWLCPALLSVVFWFFTIPTVRYVIGSFWVLGIGSFVLGIKSLFNLKKATIGYVCICGLYIIFSYIGGMGDFIKLAKRGKIGDAFDKVHLVNVVFKGKGDHGFHTIPKMEFKIFKTDSGLVLNVPSSCIKCLDAPLPCTPYPNSALILRRTGDMRYGFKVTLKNKT